MKEVGLVMAGNYQHQKNCHLCTITKNGYRLTNLYGSRLIVEELIACVVGDN